jgi:hypothetical protein
MPTPTAVDARVNPARSSIAQNRMSKEALLPAARPAGAELTRIIKPVMITQITNTVVAYLSR